MALSTRSWILTGPDRVGGWKVSLTGAKPLMVSRAPHLARKGDFVQEACMRKGLLLPAIVENVIDQRSVLS